MAVSEFHDSVNNKFSYIVTNQALAHLMNFYFLKHIMGSLWKLKFTDWANACIFSNVFYLCN